MSGWTPSAGVLKWHIPLLTNELWEVHEVWEQFGRALPVNEAVIGTIKANQHPVLISNREKLQEALTVWRREGNTRTWKVIRDSLLQIRRKDVADKIEMEHPNLEVDGGFSICVPYDSDNYIWEMTETLKGVIPQWSSFSFALGLSYEAIQEIKGDTYTVDSCFTELLSQWIKVKGREATFEKVIDACRKIGYGEIANKLDTDEEFHHKLLHNKTLDDTVPILENDYVKPQQFNFIRLIWRLAPIMLLIAAIYHQYSSHHHPVVSSSSMYTTELKLSHRRCNAQDNPPSNSLPKLEANPFMGRETNMSYLERVLLSGSVNVLGINGAPGFGKSTIAIKLGWKMVESCFKVGYIDMDLNHEILSHVVKSFNERRLALQAWRPPMGDSNEHVYTGAGGEILNGFVGESLLIIDNCNHALNHEKSRDDFMEFLSAMIKKNENGRILFTSDEKLNLYGMPDYKYDFFEVEKLSVEASVKVLKYYSPNIDMNDATNIASAVENCPIALILIGSYIKMDHGDKPAQIVSKLNDRKATLKFLNKTENKYLPFVALMDIAFDYLKFGEKMSAMFVSFFPSLFPIETAVTIIMQSDEKYNFHLANNAEVAVNSIRELHIRSLLERASFGDVQRYKMHRLLKMYFMDQGEQYDDKMEADFNSSFRIYFSKLQVREQLSSLNEVSTKIKEQLLSDYDRHNFQYLAAMLLFEFETHLYSEDELVYLALAYHKGLINFDYSYSKKLLELYTYRHLRVATLPKTWKWTNENVVGLASDFNNFFVNVLCKLSSDDICLTIYMDLLYKVYKSENCSDVFEDNFEDTCRIVNCDYINDYFAVLDKLSAFPKMCTNAIDPDARKFCSLLLSVHHMCTAFEFLKFPLKNALLSFVFVVCCGLIIMVITCFRVRRLPVLLCKHFGILVLVLIIFIAFSYTRSLRKLVGIYFDAPIEVHSRNVICSVVMFLYIILLSCRVLYGFMQCKRCPIF